MTLEEKWQQYQLILVDEYRKMHPEATDGLTNEDVALMNPLSDFEFTMFIQNELSSINEEMEEIKEEIEIIEKLMDEPGLHYQQKTEFRADRSDYRRKLQELEDKYASLKEFLAKRENKDERSR